MPEWRGHSIGGVPCLDWQPLTRNNLLDRLPEIAKSHVLALDLVQMGVNPGLLQPLRLNETMPVAPIELSLDTQSLPRAGWPNDGWATVHSPSSSRRMNRWLLDHPVPTTETNNAWAFGFWSNDWSTSFESIRLDGNRREASLDPTSTVHEIQVGARYRLSNLLSELDTPGEWVIDEASGLLLYWPLENRSPTEIVASNLELSYHCMMSRMLSSKGAASNQRDRWGLKSLVDAMWYFAIAQSSTPAT